MFQCCSSNSSNSSGGLTAIVCHWQFTIETSFLLYLCIVIINFTQYLFGKSQFKPVFKVMF